MDLFGEGAAAPPVRLERGAVPRPAPWASLDAAVAELGLRQHEAHMGGRVVPVPRLEGWYGDPGTPGYAFGGRAYVAAPWPATLQLVGRCVQELTGERFEACFANYYRGAADHIPWHADDEGWIGPVIASVSYGCARVFELRPKVRAPREGACWQGELGEGDLLVMGAGCQQAWEHRAPPSRRLAGPRLNLTFRQVRHSNLGRGFQRSTH